MEDYKKKLELAKQLYDSGSYDNETIEAIFPELKESEDERIRKEIIQFLQLRHPQFVGKRNHVEWITWLEKQSDYSKLVEEIKERKELISKEKEKATSTNDKLSLGGRIAMLEELLAFTKEKQGEQKSLGYIHHIDKDGNYTKEPIEQKSAWSEEDEKMLGKCIDAASGYYSPEDKEQMKEWLKSLKPQKQNTMSNDEFEHIVGYLVQDIVANERMPEGEKQPTKFFVEKYYNKLKPQSHWKPTEEQMIAFGDILGFLKDYGYTTDELVSLFNNLQKL